MEEPRYTEIDPLIAAFYAAFDNRGAGRPATEALHELFAAHGRITRVTRDGVESWSVEEFIAPRAAMLTNGTLTDFHEWETACTTTVFDGIANRESHYRKSGTLNGEAYSGEGRKFISLYRTGGRWLIASVLWEDS